MENYSPLELFGAFFWDFTGPITLAMIPFGSAIFVLRTSEKIEISAGHLYKRLLLLGYGLLIIGSALLAAFIDWGGFVLILGLLSNYSACIAAGIAGIRKKRPALIITGILPIFLVPWCYWAVTSGESRSLRHGDSLEYALMLSTAVSPSALFLAFFPCQGNVRTMMAALWLAVNFLVVGIMTLSAYDVLCEAYCGKPEQQPLAEAQENKPVNTQNEQKKLTGFYVHPVMPLAINTPAGWVVRRETADFVEFGPALIKKNESLFRIVVHGENFDSLQSCLKAVDTIQAYANEGDSSVLVLKETRSIRVDGRNARLREEDLTAVGAYALTAYLVDDNHCYSLSLHLPCCLYQSITTEDRKLHQLFLASVKFRSHP